MAVTGLRQGRENRRKSAICAVFLNQSRFMAVISALCHCPDTEFGYCEHEVVSLAKVLT